MLNRRLKTDEVEQYLLVLIRQIREDHKTLSCRAMYYMIAPVNLGRDAFEAICRGNHFTIQKKQQSCRTTNSAGVIRFENLLNGKKLCYMDQAWCSDITYYEVNKRFFFIVFVIDCYSRRIIGHCTSQHLFTVSTTLPALRSAIRTRKNRIPAGLIIHSDGGGQYYAKAFLKLTKKYEMQNSMCEYAYENGKAERVNGIIKINYLKFYTIRSFKDLEKCVDRAVTLYNNRPHKSLNYLSPIMFENKADNDEVVRRKHSFIGALSPYKIEQTKPPTQRSLSAK